MIHWLLYLLLLVVPVLGWINASWRGMPIVLFGLELPKLIGTRAPGWRWTGDVHNLLANYMMLTLVGLHILAGLITTSSAVITFFSECCRAASVLFTASRVECPEFVPSVYAMSSRL